MAGVYSKWRCGSLTIGGSGGGLLSMVNGASLYSGQTVLGLNSGASGTASMSSVVWSCSSLTIGASGAGLINVGSLSRLTSTSGILGLNAGASGTVSVNGVGTTWGSGSLTIGAGGAGLLSISGGGTVTAANTCLGYGSGSFGTLTVNGTKSDFITSSSYGLTLGNFGTGVLSITNGGTVHGNVGYLGYKSGASGLVTVEGTNSAWLMEYDLYAGREGTGTLNIAKGGHVNCNFGYVGYEAGASGTVMVKGSNSSWNPSEFRLGVSGTGRLEISEGGQVTTDYGHVAYEAGSVGIVSVDGTGSKLTCTYNLFLGTQGSGTLNITNGGTVTSANPAYVGQNAGATGVVMIDGNGSKLACNSGLSVGTGTVTITNGGWLSASSLRLGGSAGGTAVAMVDGAGSKLSCGGLSVAGGSTNRLTISHGGIVDSGNVYFPVSDTSPSPIQFGAGGGTLTAKTLYGNPSQVLGTGIVNAYGFVNDGEWIFDKSHGLYRTTTFVSDQQNVTLNLDLTGGKSVAGDVGVGCESSGTLTIRDGMVVPANMGYVGKNAGTTGIATVEGSGSTWDCSGDVYVGMGQESVGTLRLAKGGLVNSSVGYIASQINSTGSVVVDGAGSTWTNSGSLTIGNYGPGKLTVTNGGKVSNTNGYVGNRGGATCTVTVDGTGSMWNNSGSLTIGDFGTGTLTVTNGGRVSNTNGYVGNRGGATCTVTVDGSGSTWTSTGSLIIGFNCTGMLAITNGGKVNNTSGYLGYSPSSAGTARVDGTDSMWNNSGSLTIGYYGIGAMTVANGGKVTATGIFAGSTSTVAMNVGDGSSLSAGTGTLTNWGVVRLTAAASATAGTYVPITAAKWAGTGTVQALGGTWDAGSHVFTVNAAAAGAAGVGVTVDRAVTQRVVITDGTSGEGVVVGFMGTSGSSNVTLTGWELTAEQEAALVGVVPAGQQVLEGWTFAAEGYTAGEPVSLALKVGSGWASENLNVWHFDGSSWTAFAASDLAYDGMYASFTVTGFSGYAVTGVPEPAGLAIMALGAMGLLRRRRRRG
jgi:T5SS/PEP-CTERM-associated repeat protein